VKTAAAHPASAAITARRTSTRILLHLPGN
jgi:hypothetical protein